MVHHLVRVSVRWPWLMRSDANASPHPWGLPVSKYNSVGSRRTGSKEPYVSSLLWCVCCVGDNRAGVNVGVGLNFDISRVSFKLQFWLRGPEIESRMPPSPHLGPRVGMRVGLNTCNSEFDRARKLTTRRSQDAAAVCSGFTRIGLRSTRQPRRSGPSCSPLCGGAGERGCGLDAPGATLLWC